MRTAPLLSIILAALLAGAGCSSGGDKPGAGAGRGGPDAGAAAPVEAVPASVATVRDGIEATGTVEARQSAILRARVAGTIDPFTVDEGTQVEANQTLARIRRPAQADVLAQAEARTQKTRRDVKNLERLAKDGLVPKQELTEARFTARQARLELQRLKNERGQERVISPLAGVITARAVQPGEAITPGAELFRVANPDALEVHLRVPERHLARLRPDLPVEVEADGLGDARLKGTVARIAPTVDPASGTVKVTVDLGDGRLTARPGQAAGLRLRPGMYVRCRVVVDTREDAITVPKRALIQEDERASVYVIRDGQAFKTPVELGYADRDRVQITQGVAAGEPVIVFGHRGLDDGAAVKRVGRPGAAPVSAPASAAASAAAGPASAAATPSSAPTSPASAAATPSSAPTGQGG